MADSEPSLVFPDGPRTELDRVIAQLIRASQDVLATQGRLRSLLDASRLVSTELELAVVLRRIVEAAVRLVGARYGAIGVVAPDGTLEQFIHVGMADDDVRRIGHLPEGHGLLGALIDKQEPIRLEHLRDDERSIGFPPEHPPMEGFLGVPVRVRGEVFGNLYLTEPESGPFTPEDQELLVALAETAGAAVHHARLFDESQLRQRWSAASAEVTAAMLSESADDSLAILADRVAALSDADLVCIALPASDTTMTISIARGHLEATFTGTSFESAGTLAGLALEGGQPILSDMQQTSRVDPQLSFGPTMALPLSSSDSPVGVLTVSRLPGRARFTTSDLEMAADFAAQASVALTLAAARTDSQRLAVLEDRGRIARDLHDHVIQRLFGAGLSLQAVATTVPAAAQAKIAEQVEVLDSAIAEIRTAIFALASPPTSHGSAFRHRVLDLLGEVAELFPVSPRVSFSGPVDLMVDGALADVAVAVIREGLTNVARHAAATDVALVLAVEANQFVVTVDDDGIGIDPSQSRNSGTANLGQRATSRGGTFELTRREPRGTRLRWSVPLQDMGNV